MRTHFLFDAKGVCRPSSTSQESCVAPGLELGSGPYLRSLKRNFLSAFALRCIVSVSNVPRA